jgi:hypothetical protein
LRGLSVVALDLARHQQVEGLIGAAELHVRLEGDRVVRLHEGIEEFVRGDRIAGRVAFRKIVALEQPRHRVARAELHDLGRRHRHPLAVEADFGARHVEHPPRLLDVGCGVALDLLAALRRTRLLAPRRIADSRGEIPDQEDRRVAQLLEATKLLEHDRVSEMQIGRGGIHAELHAQGTARAQSLREALAQLALAVELDRSLAHASAAADPLDLGRRHPASLSAQCRPVSVITASTRRSVSTRGSASTSWI